MIKRIAVYILLVLLLGACDSQSKLSSVNYPDDKKIELIKSKIAAHSDIKWAEFSLYDVNNNDFLIPGASNKDYKIVISVDKKDIRKWIENKQNLMTAVPISNEWISEVLSKEKYSELIKLPYTIYSEEKDGYNYTLFVNEEHGIILMRFIQT